MARKFKGSYSDEIMRIVNTPLSEVARMSAKAMLKHRHTVNWVREQEKEARKVERERREAAKALKAARTAELRNASAAPITAKKVASGILSVLLPFDFAFKGLGFAYGLFVQLVADIGGKGVKVRPNGLPAEVPVPRTLAQIGGALAACGNAAAGRSTLPRTRASPESRRRAPPFARQSPRPGRPSFRRRR